MTEYVYTVEGMPLGPNFNMRGDRLNGWRAREASRKAHAAMREVLKAGIRPSLYPIPKAEIHYVFYLPTWRHRDIEALQSQCKPYIDEMVSFGIIAGDSWRFIPRRSQEAVYRKNQPGFEIIVKPIEG